MFSLFLNEYALYDMNKHEYTVIGKYVSSLNKSLIHLRAFIKPFPSFNRRHAAARLLLSLRSCPTTYSL